MTMKQATGFLVHPGWRLTIADAGISVSDVLALSQLPGDLFARRDAWLTPAEYFRLWHGIEAASEEKNASLALGRAISVEAFDPAIFASLCSANLDVALSRLAEYKRLIGPLTLDLVVTGSYTEVAFYCYAHDGPLPRCLATFEAIFLTQLARIATRSEIRPISCELVEPPVKEAECEEFLGCRIVKGPLNKIRFSAKDASSPFLTENLAMWEFFEPALRLRLSKLDMEASVRERVRGVLLDMLPSGQSSIDEVSRRLAVSRRSLQRQLEKEDVQFRDVLNEVRGELASHYLAHSDLATSQISYLLGFHDTNSFLRAFKAWTGSTPGEFRTEGPERRIERADFCGDGTVEATDTGDGIVSHVI